jgi:hypothetical protein
MAEYCGEGCYAVCDFCSYYRDDLRDLQKSKKQFAAEGICIKINKRVEANDGYNCEDFRCFRLDRKEI